VKEAVMTNLSKKQAIVKPTFRVGDRVKFQFVTTPVEGVVIEDRGFIGSGGRQLVTVEIDEPDFHVVLEMPSEELEPA
jgi:hypothetical protein